MSDGRVAIELEDDVVARIEAFAASKGMTPEAALEALLIEGIDNFQNMTEEEKQAFIQQIKNKEDTQ